MACSKKLQRRVITTCEKLYHFHKEHNVICGCEFLQYSGVRCNVSYLTEKQLEKKLDEIIKQELKKIGQLGHQRDDKHITKCFNYIGNCAEVHSANDVYNQMKQEQKPDPKHLNFAVSYRISTMQPIDYCQNCKDTFGLTSIKV